jgi:hypothetical protein
MPAIVPQGGGRRKESRVPSCRMPPTCVHSAPNVLTRITGALHGWGNDATNCSTTAAASSAAVTGWAAA